MGLSGALKGRIKTRTLFLSNFIASSPIATIQVLLVLVVPQMYKMPYKQREKLSLPWTAYHVRGRTNQLVKGVQHISIMIRVMISCVFIVLFFLF